MGVEKYKHLISWSSKDLLMEEAVGSATLPGGLELFETSNHLIKTDKLEAHFWRGTTKLLRICSF